MPEGTRLGLALSGGGHRAAVWSAGAVLGLVDAGVHDRITSISSVSGGSIANGVLAAGGDVRSADRPRVEEWIKRGLGQWAHEGLFFPGPATDRWTARTLGSTTAGVALLLAALAATVAASRDWSYRTVLFVALGLLAVMLVPLWLALGKLRGRVALLVVLGAVLVHPLSVVAMTVATDSAWWLLLVWPLAIAGLVLVARRFGSRSLAAVDALEHTLFAGADGPLRLADLAARPVHHVFCATDLRTGNNLYLTNRMVWGSPDLLSEPGSVTVATAVQASACLPGAFLARTIDPLPSAPAGRRVVLSDGGVYDNMADQWEWGLPNRRDQVAKFPNGTLLATAQPDAATHLVVVNASRGMGGVGTVATKPGLKGELTSALAAKDVLYDVSTATRRRILIDLFQRATKNPSDGLGGMLVHIGTSPYKLVDGWAKGGGPEAARATEAGAMLDRLTDLEWPDPAATDETRRKKWAEVTSASASVKTTLAPIGDAAVGLLHHAWVLTRITAYVIHDWGALPQSDLAAWRRQRFVDLVAASAPSVA